MPRKTRRRLGRPDVLAARSLGTLPDVEADALSFAHAVERNLAAGRLVEEVFVPVGRRDKAKALVAHESLDRAIHRRHVSPSRLSSLGRTCVNYAGATDVC